MATQHPGSRGPIAEIMVVLILIAAGCATPTPSSLPPGPLAPASSASPTAPSQRVPSSSAAPTAPVVLPSVVAGNPLQPLADDLTWVYEMTTQGESVKRPIVFAVVGTERIEEETAWLYEFSIGTSTASRLVVVERGGDVWAIAVETIVDGRWARTRFPTAQLYQPRPEARSWRQDYRGGPEVWSYQADFQQRPNGRLSWFGRDWTAWLSEGTYTFGATTSREVDTLLEGIGIAVFTSIYEGGGSRSELTSFGTDPPPLVGRWTGGGELTLILDVTATGATISISGGRAQPVQDWTVDGERISFAFAPLGEVVSVTAALRPYGIVGTLEGGGREQVFELIRALDDSSGGPTPAPASPSASASTG